MAGMEVMVTIPVLEVDMFPVEEGELVVMNHPMRRDYVVLEWCGKKISVSPSDLERAMQAAKLAHRV
jgi:hypothetical protein